MVELANSVFSGKKRNFKVSKLRDIEIKIQKEWEDNHIFEVDAPTHFEHNNDKFLVTFPYPYMNGLLHLGHAFTLSKCEACADKLKEELSQTETGAELLSENGVLPNPERDETNDVDIVDKSKSKKSKANAKCVKALSQWQILKSMNIPEEEIPKFVNTDKWLQYFPSLAISHLQRLGVKVDWRRSFVTTDVNPFYDSFVHWQFLHLKRKEKIKYGKRYTIFSPKNNQPCLDHDRLSGEGVNPQEYTLIKLEVVKPYPRVLQAFSGEKVFLLAATLRPETMYGQTNVWLSPTIQYFACRSSDQCIIISNYRAMLNMSYQNLLVSAFGVVETLSSFIGSDLLGVALKAPLSHYDVIYTLPMMTVKSNRGTSIVTSVPSDSPDDFIALEDLKNKEAFRHKYNIKDDMVLPFEAIPIISVPEMGTLAAPKVCKELAIKSQNDSEKLAIAKERVYLKGFYEGILIVGEYKDNRVQDVKKEIQRKLVDEGAALLYMEPEKEVVSRSRDECVVALCDQWFLDYGNKAWKDVVSYYVKEHLETFSKDVLKNFEATLAWIKDHACSRTYGLGSKIPWDKTWLIESLSDSTIYMAYYTVAHLLQEGNLRGTLENSLGIKVEDMIPEVWDFIFNLSSSIPENSKISEQKLLLLKNEFMYWYPVDLRASGKDLIPNHLTFYLYNHAAIWQNDESKWPKAVKASGLLLLDNEKMSKSTGNFMTLLDAINEFGADATRFALSDAGDGIEDSNFVKQTASTAVLRLYAFLEWTEVLDERNECVLRRIEMPFLWMDHVFDNEIKFCASETDKYMKQMLFKEALRTGFYEMQAAKDRYQEMCGNIKMRTDLVLKFVEIQCLLLNPICPHVTQFIFQDVFKENILSRTWPANNTPVNVSLLKSSQYFFKCLRDFRLHMKSLASQKTKSKQIFNPTHASIYIAKEFPKWQQSVIDALIELKASNNGQLPENSEVAAYLKKVSVVDNKYVKKLMPFAQIIKGDLENIHISFNEEQVLKSNLSFLKNALHLDDIEVIWANDENLSPKLLEDVSPGKPIILFEPKPSISCALLNTQPMTSLFSLSVAICDGITAKEVKERLILRLKDRNTLPMSSIQLYIDFNVSNRKLLINEEDSTNIHIICDDDVFSICFDKRDIFLKKRR